MNSFSISSVNNKHCCTLSIIPCEQIQSASGTQYLLYVFSWKWNSSILSLCTSHRLSLFIIQDQMYIPEREGREGGDKEWLKMWHAELSVQNDFLNKHILTGHVNPTRCTVVCATTASLRLYTNTTFFVKVMHLHVTYTLTHYPPISSVIPHEWSQLEHLGCGYYIQVVLWKSDINDSNYRNCALICILNGWGLKKMPTLTTLAKVTSSTEVGLWLSKYIDSLAKPLIHHEQPRLLCTPR